MFRKFEKIAAWDVAMDVVPLLCCEKVTNTSPLSAHCN